MKNRLINIGAVTVTLILIGCGNTRENTNQVTEVQQEETPQSKDGSGQMKTITGADPNWSNSESSDETEPVDVSDLESTASEIEWLDFETAIDRNQENRKFIFIDVYTDWCSWCKKMDQSTFKNSSVIKYMDEYFYCVKMNAESSEAIAYKEVLYESKQFGKKKYNELAVNLMNGKISFPSFVVLNKREVKRGVIKGFQTSSQLLSLLNGYVK